MIPDKTNRNFSIAVIHGINSPFFLQSLSLQRTNLQI